MKIKNIDSDFEDKKKNVSKKTDEKQQQSKRRSEALITREKNTIYRRCFSESQLIDLIGINHKFEDGQTIHFITGGDIDAMTYLRAMVRHQDIEHLLFSTWCMANDDILQLKEWIDEGKIKKCDAYVGEIFPSTYHVEFEELKKIITPEIGKIVVFKNHSKIFAGYGNKFYFGIQTSANINTNPRTENGNITISKELYEFYYNYFDNIISFEK